MDKVKAFLKRKNIELSWKRYLIDVMGAMAKGLFASLLIGTILDTIGAHAGIGFLSQAGAAAKAVSGAAMAVAIAFALKAPPLVMFSMVAVGQFANAEGGAGGPLAVLVIAIIACEIGKIVADETPVDIIVTPVVTILVGVGLSVLIAPALGAAAASLGRIVMWATELQPFLMGIIVSVVIGIALTLPISSAAICAALSLTGLAGGAAVAGCCAQMVGFAVMSWRENKWGGLLSQGLGTSMLQMGNIIKRPVVWLPPIIASAVTGPVATCIFHLEMNGSAVSSGMGTCGMVGPIGVISGWFSPVESAVAAGATAIAPTAFDWIGLALVSVVLPAVLCWAIGALFRRLGWIREGDLSLK